jgi:hypothetical protein
MPEFDAAEIFSAQSDPNPISNPAPDQSVHTPAPVADPSGTTGVPSGMAPSGPEAWEVPGVGQVSRDELIKGYLRTQDYTRKTMAISQQQREFEQARQQAQAYEATLQQVYQFLNDRSKLEQHLKGLPGQVPQGPEIPGDQLMTFADAQNLMSKKFGESQAQFQQRLQEGIGEAQKKILTEVYQTQFESAIDNKLRDISTRHPELGRLPGVELLLREAVKSQKPGSLDDALQLFDQAAIFYAGRVKNAAQAATVAGQPNNPLNRGLLPPSNGAPGPQAEATDFSGVRDKNLRALVEQDLMKLFQGVQE